MWDIIQILTLRCSSSVYCLLLANVFWGAFVAPAVGHVCIPPEGAVAVGTCHFVEEEHNTTLHKCQDWEYDTTYFTNTFTSQVGPIELKLSFGSRFLKCSIKSLYLYMYRQFNLVCDDAYQRATSSSVYMFGSLVGSPIGGFFADRFGSQ